MWPSSSLKLGQAMCVFVSFGPDSEFVLCQYCHVSLTLQCYSHTVLYTNYYKLHSTIVTQNQALSYLAIFGPSYPPPPQNCANIIFGLGSTIFPGQPQKNADHMHYRSKRQSQDTRTACAIRGVQKSLNRKFSSTIHSVLFTTQYYSHTVLYTQYYKVHSTTVIQYYTPKQYYALNCPLHGWRSAQYMTCCMCT